MQTKRTQLFCALFALAAFLGTAKAQALAGEETRVWVQKDGEKIECEGEDCGKMVFINHADGEHEISIGDLHKKHAKVLYRGGHFPGSGGFLGVQLTNLTQELRDHYGIPRNAGVLVGKVIEESPAAAAGLKVGDVIVSVDQKNVGHAGELSRLISQSEVDQVVTLEVWRDGGFSNYSATLGERKTHVGHAGKHKMKRRIEIHCDGDDDCHDLSEFDCGSDKCEVRVECNDDGCQCTVNDEATDCNLLPGFKAEQR